MMKAIKEREENRDVIIKNAPGLIRIFEFENQLKEVISQVKIWLP